MANQIIQELRLVKKKLNKCRNLYQICCWIVEHNQNLTVKQSIDDPTQYKVLNDDFLAEITEEDELKGEAHLDKIIPKKYKRAVVLDGLTAQALKLVYEGLSKPELKEKFLRLPLMQNVNFAWKHTKISG